MECAVEAVEEELWDAIIIGAGASGLAAFAALNEAGKKVLMLEGRDRIGGRAYTDAEFGDLGASWIHGCTAKSNSLYKLAVENAALCPLVVTDYDSKRIYDLRHAQVEVFSRERVSQCNAEFARVADKIEKLQDRGERDSSLSSGIDRAFATLAAAGKLTELLDPDVLNHFTLENFDLDYACNLHEASLWWFDCDRELVGEDCLVAERGMGTLVSRLVERGGEDGGDGTVPSSSMLEEGVNLLLQRSVVEVREESSATVSVTTHTGERFLARHVLVTVPLGVLKARTINFIPPMPRVFESALDMSAMGLLNKSVFCFDEPFWDIESTILAVITSMHEHPRGYVPWFLNLYKSHRQPWLVLFHGGSMYAEQLEAKSDEELTADAMNALSKMYPHVVRQPQKVKHTRWKSDTFARGSYAYRRVGFSPKDGGFSAFHALYHNGKTLFAGEHSSVESFATVNGAIDSGRRAAKAILKGKMEGKGK